MAASSLQDLLTNSVVQRAEKETELTLTDSFKAPTTFVIRGLTTRQKEQIREKCKRVYDNQNPTRPGLVAINETRLIGELVLEGIKEPNINNYDLRKLYGVENQPLWEIPYAMFTDSDIARIIEAINSVSEADPESGVDGATPQERIREAKN